MNRDFEILLIEDDENDVLFLKRAFHDAQIQNPMRVVSDGQEAIDYLGLAVDCKEPARYSLPCLIILDLKMPRKNGIEVLQWLHDHQDLYSIPVIVFSSSAHRYDIERAYRLGANAFVVKPSDLEKRAELARLIKGFWLTFNESPIICAQRTEAA